MERISQIQLIALASLIAASASPFYFCVFIDLSGYAVWLAVLGAAMLGLLLAYLALALARTRPDEYFGRFGRKIVGKWPHFVLAGFMAYYTIYLGAYLLRQMQEFLTQTYLHGTPNWVVGGGFAMCAALGARLGIETIARFSLIVFFAGGFLTLILVPLLYGNFELYRATAFITHISWEKVWNGTIMDSKIFGESFLILFFYPLLANRDKSGKSLAIGIGISALLMMLQLATILLIFSANLAANLPYPFLEAVRFIRIAGFLENLDPLIVTIWITAFYVKISICIYCAVLCVSQLLSLKDYRPLTYTGALLMYGYAQHMAESIAELYYIFKHANAVLGLCVELIPGIYLLVDKIRKMAAKRKNRPEEAAAESG